MRNCRPHSHSIKQYSTIEILCNYTDNDNQPLSLADVEITSDMYTSSGRFVDNLNVEILDVIAGTFILTPTVSKLPVDTLRIDVIFDKEGKRVISDTFSIEVEASITTPPGL